MDTVACDCLPRLADQPHSPPQIKPSLAGLDYPDIRIGEHRQMFQASALRKHGLLSTGSFFSERNLVALASLRTAIRRTEDPGLRSKLMFAFTGILTRASKRYQWSRERPLNAANQNYYIAPVFYEWNVFDLFERKVRAVLRADEFLCTRMQDEGTESMPEVNYTTGAAQALDLASGSVDYVFTDPPFGANIFYSDMNLFQEAWLDEFTDDSEETVVDRSGSLAERRTADRYEQLITEALQEAHRVLKPAGWLSLIFSNSTGAMWGLVQRAMIESGFELGHIAVLDKGQRSVKGLASGFENVVTADLVLSMRKAATSPIPAPTPAPEQALANAVDAALADGDNVSPSHIYLSVLRDHFGQGWDVSRLDIRVVAEALTGRGYGVDPASGHLLAA